MKKICILLLLFPFCLQAQLSGHLDSLGRKQGKFHEKMFIASNTDSLNCLVNYQDGVRARECTCTFVNGKKALRGDYTNDGKPYGNWTFWNDNGLIDFCIIFDLDGKVEEKKYYTYSDNTNDTLKEYQIAYKNPNDSLLKIEYYKDQKLIKIKDAATGHTVKVPVGRVNFRGPWAVTAGYTYQNNHWAELAIRKYSSYADEDDDLSAAFSSKNYLLAGAEIGADKNKKIELAPKVGAGVHLLLMDFNLNCILYNDQFKQLYPAITPEIGISFPIGILQINYGYNIFLVQNKFMPNETHRISVHFTIPFFGTGYQ